MIAMVDYGKEYGTGEILAVASGKQESELRQVPY